MKSKPICRWLLRFAEFSKYSPYTSVGKDATISIIKEACMKHSSMRFKTETMEMDDELRSARAARRISNPCESEATMSNSKFDAFSISHISYKANCMRLLPRTPAHANIKQPPSKSCEVTS